ncbi:nucleoside-diphosphate-sugar epimerase [Prauserella sp. Am3]|nr:nucleoside-diphosphate-sugar epimerase [Prauserella sp. Am3]
MKNIEELDEELTTPSDALVADMAALDGDILVLGVGGKVGPSVAGLAANAVRKAGSGATVYGVARFSDPDTARELEGYGVVPVRADITDEDDLRELPDVKNVIFMVGHKFGTEGNEHYTWMMNSYLPGRVAERFQDSRIVAFSTLLTYPMTDAGQGGSREGDEPGPLGEYAASCVGRERMFEHFSRKNGTPVLTFHLGYAIEMRYGVLLEIAKAVKDRSPIDLSMGYASVIWQGDVAEYALRSLHLAASPPAHLNITGPEIVPIRWLAHRFAERLGVEPVFEGEEEQTAYVLDGTKLQSLYGYPRVTLQRMIEWVADWVAADGPTIDKPTHFQQRDGKF